ncbi:MAG: tRNA (adenosine(37)-N6)-threonylcarbamoyltransferase complex ATPase subunit type 1 TsaE [Clostridiaceae bacterium]|nr:tRNA (adenosine(37)-N6)-threonylcarbamoyltransferase complex ATPase subunit type 1 TsaE [Clostridiaceae bacterium]
MTEWEWLSENPAQTEAFGRLLGELALPDDVISLDGDLGAGKTALTRGIAAGLGLTGYVTSPTFTILIEHIAGHDGRGRMSLYHFDAYRLEDADSFYDNGFDEYFSMGGLTVIEWGDLIAPALPEHTLFIRLLQTDPSRPEQRRFCLSWPACPERLLVLKERFL